MEESYLIGYAFVLETNKKINFYLVKPLTFLEFVSLRNWSTVLGYGCPLAEHNTNSSKTVDNKVETLDLACTPTKIQSPKIA